MSTPLRFLPLDQIPPEHRESVAEVIRDHTFHRLGETDSFPCRRQPVPQPAQRAAGAADALEGPEYIAGAASEDRPEPLRGNGRLRVIGRLGLRAPNSRGFTSCSRTSTMSALMAPPESKPESS